MKTTDSYSDIRTNKKADNKLMLFGAEARNALAKGVELMYQAVCSTLSPKGRNVAINRAWGIPQIVHDGITVARDVRDKNDFTQMGINLVKIASSKTNDEAGDGTTTSVLIAREVLKEGLKLVERGSNPMVLREQINKAKDEAVVGLKTLARQVKDEKDLISVATISSASKEIGELVGKAVWEMGVDGLVTVEESGSYDTYVEKSEGMSVDKGFVSPYFVTNPNRMEAVVDKPYIIITDKALTTMKDIIPLIETIINKFQSKNIVIIGEVRGQALQILVKNKYDGIINCLAIDPPSTGQYRKGLLEDIAVATGGRVISKELGLTAEELMKTIQEDWFGRADKVASDKKSTVIISGRGDKKAISNQIEMIKKQLTDVNLIAHEREILEERRGKLTTKVAVVRVGARTEVDAREMVERVKDAVEAAVSAREEGVVVGAGMTYFELQKYIKYPPGGEGAQIMKQALSAVLKKILENSGESQEEIYAIMKRLSDEPYGTGYEVVTGKIVDLNKQGILDPVKVIRLCLENGVSVAVSILSTDTLINYPPEHDRVRV